MKKQVLSIKQMEHLQRLGIDTHNASMRFIEIPTSTARMGVSNGKDFVLLVNSYVVPDDGINTYTVCDLLSMIPPRLKNKYIFKLYKVGDSFLAEYSYAGCASTLHTTLLSSVVNVLYDMIVWVIENNYLPKKYFRTNL